MDANVPFPPHPKSSFGFRSGGCGGHSSVSFVGLWRGGAFSCWKQPWEDRPLQSSSVEHGQQQSSGWLRRWSKSRLALRAPKCAKEISPWPLLCWHKAGWIHSFMLFMQIPTLSLKCCNMKSWFIWSENVFPNWLWWPCVACSSSFPSGTRCGSLLLSSLLDCFTYSIIWRKTVQNCLHLICRDVGRVLHVTNESSYVTYGKTKTSMSKLSDHQFKQKWKNVISTNFGSHPNSYQFAWNLSVSAVTASLLLQPDTGCDAPRYSFPPSAGL